MKKRVLSLLLAILMVVSMAPMSALAYRSDTDVTYAVEGGNIYFDKSTGTITGCDEYVTEAIIPDKIDGVLVKCVGAFAFDNCRNLTNVELPDSLKSILDRAFNCCTSLICIVIPYGVSDLGCSVFNYCISLKSVTIPNSVTSIGSSAFWGCASLTSVVFPDAVMSIEASVFARCTGLKSFYVKSGVTNIDTTAFYGCTNLAEIRVSPENLCYKSVEGVLFSKNAETLVMYPSGNSAEQYEVPNNVTRIGKKAFSYSGYLRDIIIPTSVISVDSYAFECCDDLKTVYYYGSEEQWKEISIGSGNECLTNATIHYNYHTHSYTAVVTPPTCTEQGYTTYTCECGDSYVEDYVGAIGHKTELANAKEATCTEAGYTGDEICTVCGETISQGEEIEPTGHHYKGNTCVDCGEHRSTGDTIRAWFRDTAQQIKSFFDKIFGRNQAA